MKKLTKEQREYIIQLLQEGKDIPEEFKYLLFPTKQKEYELVYAGKIRKEDLLANEDGVFPVPLQIDKVFNGERESWKDGWKNMIIFGDNLQFLKTVYENKDPLIKDKVKGKVKLIYIDPPFSTESDFKGKEGQKAYRDKTKGAEFVEFLRRRLILAREILADDGFIMVHLDWKKSHYIKLILDEVFGESNFRSEIIWRSSKTSGRVARPKKFDMVTTSIFLYAKKDNSYLNKQKKVVLYTEDECKEKFKWDEKERKYFKDSPRGNYSDESIEDLEKQNRVYRTRNGTIRIKTFLEEIIIDDKKMFMDFKEIDNIWDDLPTMMHVPKDEKKYDYPTQKPEALLARIIKATTDPGDLVLDFFAGSGTTAAVAEKLGRRWIVVDIGKFAYYTIQKRILQIENSKDLENPKKKYGKKARSFITARLGIYDLKQALDLEWKQYLKFVSELFEFEIKEYEIAGLKFEGKKGEYPVKVFDYRKFKNASVDENYLQNIHNSIENRISGRVYLVAPANYVDFIQDYYQIGSIRYYFLKIPYQVIKELHKIPFKKLRQPQSKKNVNDLEEVIGFHFIRQPEVKSKIKVEKNKIKLIIKEFKSQYYKDEEGKILDNFETLSAIFIDKDYNGEYFEMDEVYFADELLPRKSKKLDKNEEEIRKELKKIKDKGLVLEFDKSEIGNKIMIVYSDIYGNDFTEILNIKEK